MQDKYKQNLGKKKMDIKKNYCIALAQFLLF